MSAKKKNDDQLSLDVIGDALQGEAETSPTLEPEPDNQPIFGVTDAVTVINQTLDYAFPSITVVGEVASFKVNQGKWVFFDLKDDNSSLSCFMSVFNLRTAVEDGMKVMITARAGLTKWGKFSLTVQSIKPVGEGSIKKSFEILRAKLENEGLFAPERKRALPELPRVIGVISSTGAAGYGDFVKILDQRFGGLKIIVAHVQVQGDGAPDQIIRALNYFNECETPPEIVAILRGGGSADDLATFNDEKLVRAIAASRAPTITGVGHEIDVTLSDFAADVRAATPSNAAQIIVPERREISADLWARFRQMIATTENYLDAATSEVCAGRELMRRQVDLATNRVEDKLRYLSAMLSGLDPRAILRRGYAIMRDTKGGVIKTAVSGDNICVETDISLIEAKVNKVTAK